MPPSYDAGGSRSSLYYARLSKSEERFTFVVAFLRDDGWAFHEYTRDEFMQMSYIPPFKIFFKVPVGGDRVVMSRNGSGAVALSRRRLTMMSELFARFRGGER